MAALLRAGKVFAGVGAFAGGGLYLYSNQHLLRGGPPVSSALQPGKNLTCELREIERLSHDSARFRFGLPSPEHVLGLPTASHILAVDNAMVARAYTPITLDRYERGYFDLVVKRYKGGEFSERFHKMKVGDSMDFRGPVVTLNYEPNTALCLGMIAGGTGITPMYQIIRTVLSNPEDKTKLKLLYANRTPSDILLRSELRELQRQHPERLEIRYLVEQPQPQGNGSVEGEQDETEDVLGVGRPCAEAIRGFLPRPLDARTAVLVCGPEGMMEALCGGGMGAGAPPRLGGLLRSMGYGRQVVQFSDTNSL